MYDQAKSNARIRELELELELARLRAQAPPPQQAPQVVFTQPAQQNLRLDAAPTMKQAAGATAGAYLGLASAQIAMGCLLPIAIIVGLFLLLVDPKSLGYLAVGIAFLFLLPRLVAASGTKKRS